MSFRNNFFSICLTAISLNFIPQALAQSDGTVTFITVTQTIEEGGLVPLSIQAKGFDVDPITSLELSVETNPAEFQKALLVKFVNPQAAFLTGTSVRVATQTPATLVARFTRRSGAEFSKKVTTGAVQKPVDFQNPATLDVVFKGSVKFPTNEIGQPIKVIGPSKWSTGITSVRGILYHPMMPMIGATEGHYVHTVEFLADDELFSTYSLSGVISNNPFLQLDAAIPADDKKIKMIWRDTKSFEFSK